MTPSHRVTFSRRTPASPAAAFPRIDALLLLMAVIWGTNYSIVKSALRELDPQAFNAARMMLASAIFLAIIAALRNRPTACGRGGGAGLVRQHPAHVGADHPSRLAGARRARPGWTLRYQDRFIGGLR